MHAERGQPGEGAHVPELQQHPLPRPGLAARHRQRGQALHRKHVEDEHARRRRRREQRRAVVACRCLDALDDTRTVRIVTGAADHRHRRDEKVLAKFAEEHDAPKFKAGLVDGQLIDATTVLALSKLPSKDELLSQVLAGIQAPGNGLVSVLQGTLRNFMNVLNQIKDKSE